MEKGLFHLSVEVSSTIGDMRHLSMTVQLGRASCSFAPELDTSSDRSDAVVLGGGVELICILDKAFSAASAAAAAGGLMAAMYGLLSYLLL